MNESTQSVTLSLDELERSILTEVLREALSNLREEIGKTESFDWRQMMKEREDVLRGLLARLPTPAV